MARQATAAYSQPPAASADAGGDPPGTVRFARGLGVVLGVLSIVSAAILALAVLQSGVVLLLVPLVATFAYGALLIKLSNELGSAERSAWLACIGMGGYVALSSLASALFVDIPPELQDEVDSGQVLAVGVLAAVLAIGWCGLLLTESARDYFARDVTEVPRSVAVAAGTLVLLMALSALADGNAQFLSEWADEPLPVVIASVALMVGVYFVLQFGRLFADRMSGARPRFLGALGFVVIVGIVNAVMVTGGVRGVITGVLSVAAVAVAFERSRETSA